MEALKLVPSVVLILAITGIILGATLITTGEFGDTMDKCYNSSFSINAADNACINNTLLSADGVGRDGLNLSDEFYGIAKANEGLGTVSEQQGTMAIIAIMVIIIAVIAGTFVYMRVFR